MQLSLGQNPRSTARNSFQVHDARFVDRDERIEYSRHEYGPSVVRLQIGVHPSWVGLATFPFACFFTDLAECVS